MGLGFTVWGFRVQGFKVYRGVGSAAIVRSITSLINIFYKSEGCLLPNLAEDSGLTNLIW